MIKQVTKPMVMVMAWVLVAVLFSGCAWSVGSGKKTETIQQPTLGQELIDLKKARETGAMTEEEYQAAKTRLTHR